MFEYKLHRTDHWLPIAESDLRAVFANNPSDADWMIDKIRSGEFVSTATMQYRWRVDSKPTALDVRDGKAELWVRNPTLATLRKVSEGLEAAYGVKPTCYILGRFATRAGYEVETPLVGFKIASIGVYAVHIDFGKGEIHPMRVLALGDARFTVEVNHVD